ncbi:MAG TPA: hypothetical protein VHM94_11405 [Acidimicrobiia bacterium]|jgi:hypothetical protein|nr:hypothetical protein [Acidimicrobiia bacterium]
MFAPYCPFHRSRVLLGTDAIESLRHTSHGFEVAYTCLCGYRGIWRPTPARSRMARSAEIAAEL